MTHGLSLLHVPTVNFKHVIVCVHGCNEATLKGPAVQMIELFVQMIELFVQHLAKATVCNHAACHCYSHQFHTGR